MAECRGERNLQLLPGGKIQPCWDLSQQGRPGAASGENKRCDKE